jgi:hypothetical protein
VNVLVYDNLPAGTYTLWAGDVARASNVRVESGSVAELDWREQAPGNAGTGGSRL